MRPQGRWGNSAAMFRSLFTSPEKRSGPRRRRIDLGSGHPPYSIYAIGDVHGRLDLLLVAEHRIRSDIQACGRPGLVVLLGDYVDRGDSSAGVLSHLGDSVETGLRRIALCGNHEELFRRFLDDPLEHRQWLDMGGHETLHSYGLDGTALLERYREDSAGFRRVLREAIPDEHRTLLETLPIALRIGGYIFVHAGIRPGVPLEEQTDEDLLWIREPFLTEGSGLPATVVHGHTPSPEPTASPGRIGIDTRAYDTGRLTVLKVTARSAAVL